MSDTAQGARVRAAAALAIDAVTRSGRSLDAALEDASAEIPIQDHALLKLLCYGCLRRHWQLEAWTDALLDRPLKKRDRIIRALLAVGFLQITATRIPDHAAVSQTVEAARILRRPKHAGLLNALRAMGHGESSRAQRVRFTIPKIITTASIGLSQNNKRK